LSKNKKFSETSIGRYSLALYELSVENKSTKEIEDQSIALLDLIKNNKDFDYFIKNPTNSKQNQLKVVDQISGNFKLNKLLVKFMSFLIVKRRFFFFEKILKDFLETCSKKRGEIKAELVSAKNLSNNEIENIKNDLIKSLNLKINLNFKYDPNLIGGLIFQVGSVMVDTSIKNKLQKLEKQMLGA
tara:strand:+ start:68 stop:625 length:558 start_codon:yes stop_codon:yes gene_type:complete